MYPIGDDIISKFHGEYRNSEMKVNIVPWVLPKEIIPISIEWTKEIIFDEIQIKIPDDFKFVEFLNVEEVNVKKNQAIIKRIIKSTLPDSPNYFGFLVNSSEIYEELKIAKRITVDFLHEKNIVKSLNLDARIFRPALVATDKIDTIELTDEHEECKLPIHLKYIGFGDIRLSIRAEIKGRIVSQGESIVYELIKRLWLSENSSDDIQMGIGEENKGLSVDSEYIHQISDNLEKKIDRGDISGVLEMIDEQDIENFKIWLSDVKTRDKFSEVIYSRIEDLLLDLLSDLFERHPTKNVKLANASTKIRAKIELPLEIIEIYLKYTDTLENEYPTVKIPIKIVDKRTEKKDTIIEIPITIEKWEDEPFMNVAEMELIGEL